MESGKSIVILTGVGVSAESGLQTFRAADGLWEGHRSEDVATPEASEQDPALVHHFYNLQRAALSIVKPNTAHRAIARLQKKFHGKVTLVTQNVDDLHERGGWPEVIHMHGELVQVRCVHSGIHEEISGDSPQGQLIELRTFRSNDLALEPDESTANYDDTAWVYNERDQLIRKEYADGKGTDYTYTDGGRLLTRTWERGVVSTYGYDTAGALITTDYSDTTPDVAIVYDKIGRALITTQTNQSQIEYAYNPANLQLDTETIRYDVDHDGTFEFIRVLDRSNDTLGRSTGFTLNNGTTMENSASYAYSASDGRLGTVADGTDSFSYLYVPNSSLVNSITGPVHTVTNSWENTRNVLLTKKNEVGSTVVSQYSYNVNSIGQRTSLTSAFDLGGSHANNSGLTDWSYDSLGQLVSADAPGSTSDRGYLFDSIGNRRGIRNGAIGVPTETNGAITSGQGTELYSANLLNQYSTIPQAPATPTYDDDGNMVTGPLPADPTLSSTLQWDAENRLIQTQVGTSGTLVKNLYDSQSRRIAKIVGTTTTLYVYDGWNCIAEYSGGTLSKTRLWGMDLSGSMQGAGGVGGMLAETQGSNSFYPTFDGNGNVSEYLYANGNVAAHFEYDPFGNTVVNTDASGNFEYRFSTKPLSAETGLYYYGYRYYDPQTGRWPSRDPLGDEAFFETVIKSITKDMSFENAEEVFESAIDQTYSNLYSFVKNSSIDNYDSFGLLCCWTCIKGLDVIDKKDPRYPLGIRHPRYGILYYQEVKYCVEGGTGCIGTYSGKSAISAMTTTKPPFPFPPPPPIFGSY